MTEPTTRDEELLLDLLTGFLDPGEAAALEERLASDEPLAALRARLQEEQEALQEALAPRSFEAPPADLSERVLAGFAAREAAPSPGILMGRSRSPAGRGLALLAAASLIAGGLVALQALSPDRPREVMNRQVRTSELLALGIAPEAPQ